jgi:sugar lactone lactonase YvrE
MRRAFPVVFSVCLLASSLLTGCSSGTARVATPQVQGSGMSGSVHGGNQPVSGATIQIYAPGTTGYGSTATPLVTGTPLLTGPDGSFTFGNRGLSCPSGPGGRDRLYLTATGGDPGFGGGANNDALFLMTIIDNCQTLNASSFFSVSEVSTVASIYALAQFMNPTTGSIGAYGSSATGLHNAFDLAVTLFNPSTGLAHVTTPSGGGNGLVPQTTIDTLANIITPCVNSSGSTSAACAALFPLTTNTTPSNTGLAALQMALHPGTNVATLYSLAQANAPFQPSLATPPNDLTLSVAYHTGAGTPTGMALDGFGNIWIADYESGGNTSRLFRVSPIGVPASFANGTNDLKNVAVDSKNNVWGLVPTANWVTEFNTAGNSLTTLTATNSGATPQSIAIDSGDNPWVSDSGSHVSEVNVLNTQTVSFGGALASPGAISFDSSGNAWVPSSGASSLTKISAAGVTVGTYTGGGLNGPNSTAIDGSGNVYAGNSAGTAVSEFSSSGTAATPAGYVFTSAGPTSSIAVDGSGHLWSAGSNNLLSEIYNGALVSPATGYQSPGIHAPNGIGIDASGNVWVMDKNLATVNGTFVNLINFVGLATPAVTPLAAAVRNGQIGVAAGTPIPVSVVSSTLPYYTVGTPYTANLVATGGSGSFAWTSTTLPAGLSLSSTGVINGTPSGSGAPVSFTVTDTALATNTATRSITLSPTTDLPVGPNTANLAGRYAVLIKGFSSGSTSTSGGVNGFAVLGSLNFDGVGNVDGEMDYNGSSGSALAQSITGTYTVGGDLRGTMLLTNTTADPNAAIPRQIAFSVANSYNTLYLTNFDSTSSAGATASGIAKVQTPAQFTTTTVNQNFVFGLDGETTCTTCGTPIAPYYGPLTVAGRLAVASPSSVTGVEDTAAVDASYTQVALTGSYFAPDIAIGRGTITLDNSSTIFPNYSDLYLYYIVNANEIFLMSAFPHSDYDLLSGDAVVQTQTFSSTAANNNGIFNGNYVLSSTATKNGDGTASFPSVTDNFLISANSTGTGSATVVQDENHAGLITIESTLGTVGYSIDATGRMTLSQGANTVPISFYLANGTTGFGTQTPSASNGGEPGLIKVEHQSGTLACATPSGAFSFGSYAPPVPQSIGSGSASFSAGTVTATIDESDPSGVLASGATDTFTCTADSATPTIGRLTYTDAAGQTSVGYIVSPTEILLMNATANHAREGIKVLTAQ